MPQYKIYTHTGTIVGADNRTSKDYKRKAYLRKTKKYWIDPKGKRFEQGFGSAPGSWPMYRLDVETLEKLEKPVKIKVGK